MTKLQIYTLNTIGVLIYVGVVVVTFRMAF